MSNDSKHSSVSPKVEEDDNDEKLSEHVELTDDESMEDAVDVDFFDAC